MRIQLETKYKGLQHVSGEQLSGSKCTHAMLRCLESLDSHTENDELILR